MVNVNRHRPFGGLDAVGPRHKTPGKRARLESPRNTKLDSGSVFSGFCPAPSPPQALLSATVQNVPGVLSHVSGMLASRGYNIDSLAVGETEDPGFSRMTFVLRGDDRVLEQVRRQLEKIVTVVRVDDISSRNFVERDLMLIKVAAEAGRSRTEVKELAEIFRGRIVDVTADNVVVEMSGTEKKLEGFIEMMRPHGILELVRTGRIAMVRGSPPTRELTEADAGSLPVAEAGAESLA